MTTFARRTMLGLLASLPSALALDSTARAESAATIDSVLQKVNAARDGLKSLTGPFTQERSIGLMAAKVKSTGTLTLLRPDRLRWELAPPDAVVYWVGPEGLAYKSARGGQGRVPPTQARIAAALEDLRLVLGGDLGALRVRYDLTLNGASDDAYAFSAVPKDQSAKIKRIDFELDARDSGSPRKVVLIEGAKDKTEITFGKLQRDAQVDAKAMRPDF